MELRSVDPASNRFRRYALTVQFSLAGGGDLVIQWGRIGAPMRTRVEHFESSQALQRRYSDLLARRRRHEYVAHPANDLTVDHLSRTHEASLAAGAHLDTSRYLPLVQSNGYTGVFDGHLQVFIVRDTELEVAAPLARSFNASPRIAQNFLAAAR